MTRVKGFSLIELVVVIILLGILAVSVVPRLTAASSYEQVAQRDEALAVLHNVQMRAMQNTQTTYPTCHRILFLTSSLGLAAQTAAGSCDSSLVASSGDINDFNIVTDISSYTATNAAGSAIGQLEFDSLGIPSVDSGSCATSGCRIDFGTEAVCIESQGYIRVCP